MRVSGNDHLKSGGLWIQVECAEVVQHVYQAVTYGDDLGFRQAGGPIAPVHVATHRVERGELAEGSKHFGSAGVAGVDDQGRTTQRRQGLRPEQTVGICDHTDRDHVSGFAAGS